FPGTKAIVARLTERLNCAIVVGPPHHVPAGSLKHFICATGDTVGLLLHVVAAAGDRRRLATRTCSSLHYTSSRPFPSLTNHRFHMQNRPTAALSPPYFDDAVAAADGYPQIGSSEDRPYPHYPDSGLPLASAAGVTGRPRRTKGSPRYSHDLL